MTLDRDLFDQAYHLFVEEALELLHQIQDGLLELRDDPSLSQIHALMKTVSEIENGAAQVNLSQIENLARRLENSFRALWQEQIAIDDHSIDLLGQAYDCLRQALLAQIQTNAEEVAEILVKAEVIFTQLEAKPHPDLSLESAIADQLEATAPSRFFDREVIKALNDLETVLSIAELEGGTEACKNQIEVFLRLGEVLKISEFVAIAQITLATLQATPQASQTIGSVALAGFRSAWESMSSHTTFPATDGALTSLPISEADLLLKEQDSHSFSSVNDILQGLVPVPGWIDEARSLDRLPNEESPPIPTEFLKLHSFPVTDETIFNTDKFLVWLVGTTALTIASESIEEILLPQSNGDESDETNGLIAWRKQTIPLYALSQLLTYHYPQPQRDSLFSSPSSRDSIVAIVNLGDRLCALTLAIDGLVTESPLTLKPFGSPIAPPAYCRGCTLLEDDRLTLVIDLLALLDRAIPSRATQTPTILAIDDSNTLRQIVVLTLEKAGYRVLQARDGREGIEKLRQNPHIGLVISDIEMPNLNGFGFLKCCTQEPRLAKIPVVLLSSYYSEQHRQMAMQLGAIAYLTKPYQESEFLSTIESVLGAAKNT